MSSDFVVHHDRVTAPGADPNKWMLILHGILGSGSNWRSFGRRLAQDLPSWGFVLVDLRAHGQSTHAPPPHSVQSAADDLIRLEGRLGVRVNAVLGHSFGGKVALALADQNPTRLEQVWVLDSQPGSKLEELNSARTAAVVRMLEQMPGVLPSRERFVEIVEEQGHDRMFAAWLAMNLRRADDGYRLRVDMSAIRALFESYYRTDLWHVVETHTKAQDMRFVIGGRSEVIGPEDRARLQAIAAREPHVSLHILENAGHWLHVDDPEGLYSVVRRGIASEI